MTSRHRTFAFAAVSAFALLGGAGLFAAQPSSETSEHWTTGERRRAVGDWLVEDAADPGHGWEVSLQREADEYMIHYQILLNGLGAPRVEGHEVLYLDCDRHGGEGIESGRADGEHDRPRDWVIDTLVSCAMTREAAEEAVQGFERAYALADRWADEREAEMAAYQAVGAAEEAMSTEINVAESMDMAVDMNSGDMGVALDMNAADMNWTADAAPSTHAPAPQ
jgi:hypothetical protein